MRKKKACGDHIYGPTEAMVRAVRIACRTILSGNSYLFAIAVMSIAIGMGTAVFSLAEAVVFRPLPFPGQQSLRVIWKADFRSANPFLELAYPELHDLQEGVPALESVALMPTTLYGYGKVIRIGNQEPIQVESAPVSHDFFKTLGVHPALGRDFENSDEHPGAAPVVILSDSCWRTQFHQDAQIVGRQITLNGAGYTVIGVAGPAIDFPKGVGLWVPLGVNRNLNNRNASFLQAIARVKPGHSPEEADAQVAALFKRLARDYPQFYSATQQAVITPLSRYWIGSARAQFLASLAASLLLLVAGSVTAGNLFLSRTLARRQEIATRSALGAATLQVFRQFLVEGLVAASSAGLIGIAIAWFIIKILVSFAPPDIPRLSDAGVNWQALCFAAGVSFFMVLACSAGPIIIAVRMNLEAALREGSSRLASTRRGGHLQTVFILVQTAATVVLIAASLLIVGSVRAMLRTDIGFSHLDTVTINLALRGVDTDHRNRFYKDLLTLLRQSPSVTAAGAVLVRPMEGSIGWDRTYRSEFDLARNTKQLPVSNFEVITPGYFQAVGTPMIEGRDFTDHDRENAPKVVIVSQGLAEKLRASGHNPIGARILLNDDDEWSTIVGVTARTRYRGVVTRDEDIYVCYLQTGLPVNYLAILGRTTSQELTSLVRHEVAALDSTQAVANIATIGELVQRNTARQRFNMTMLLSFGLTSLLLTAAGLYSVIAEIVSLKNREIAIRLALGSNRVSLVRSLIEKIMGFVLIGETIGLAAVLLFGRAVTHLLYAIKPSDPFVLSAAMFLVLIVAIIAASIPAWITSGRNPRSILQ